MLLGYGAKNCWCFKEWLEISLRENIDNNEDKTSAAIDKTQLLMGFQGANASGKTNALKVFAFITDFVLNSFSYHPEKPIPYKTFFNNTDSSEFFVEFTDAESNEYRYEAVLHSDHVDTETIIKIGKAEEIILRRENNTLTINNLFTRKIDPIFRNNASVISTLRQHGVNEINPISTFFSNVSTNVNYQGLAYELERLIPVITEQFYHDHDALSFATNLIRKFDTGITDIDIRREEGIFQKVYFSTICMHDNNNEPSSLLLIEESTGTKALYTNLYFYYKCIKTGGVLILDEFDINLHSDILPHLLRLFTDADINTNNAQLIFTSLNTDIMNILGSSGTYLFEKEHGESYCYRLDEIQSNIIKKGSSIADSYKRHFLGGYPKIEP